MVQKLDSGLNGDGVLQQRLADGVLFRARGADSARPEDTQSRRCQTAQQQEHEDRPQQPGGVPHMLHPLPHSGADLLPCQGKRPKLTQHRSSALFCAHKHMY